MASADVTVWLVDPIAPPQELARLDEALVTYDDSEAASAGAWLQSILSPFEAPAESLRVAGRQVVLRRWMGLGDAASRPPLDLAPLRQPRVLRSVGDAGVGQRVADWIVRQALVRLADEAVAPGTRLQVRAIGAWPDAAAPAGWLTLSPVPGEGPAPSGPVQEVLVRGPGPHGDVPRPAGHAIVLAPFEDTRRLARWRCDPAASDTEIGVTLCLGGTPLAGPVSCPGGYPIPALVEALLLALDGIEDMHAGHAMDGDTVDRLAHRHQLVLAALVGDDGPLMRCHWERWRARRPAPRRAEAKPAPARAAAPAEEGATGLPGAIACALLAQVPATLFNVCDRVFDAAHLHSAACLIDPVDGRTWRYAALREVVLAHAGRLRSLGLRPGDRVGFAGQDGFDAAALMLACFSEGLVFAPMNPGASFAHCVAMLEVAQPAVVLGDERTLMQRADELRPYPTWTIPDFLGRHAPSPRGPRAVAADTPAVMLFTSGSTGLPKAVLHTHGDLVTSSMNYGRHVLALRSGDCLYTPSRIFFTYGLNNLMLGLQAGASVVLSVPLSAGTALGDVLRRHAVSVFMAVPATLKLAVARAQADGGWPALRLCVSAGERLPARLRHLAMCHFGVDVIDGIGSTETLSTFVSNRPGDPHAAGTGRVVPGFGVKLLDDEGRPCRVGEVGVMWVQGATLARRYEGTEPAATGTFCDGWFNTQDLFFVDALQRFHHVGRAGNVIKINACWFSPDTLEATLQAHPAVRECAVCVLHDEHGLPRPLACV
ncbi:MAG TPA: AMP-binding protein, partial [Burkholderiaceae bacterium]|nr:AMP-binding protein [Burkholderiaceae bacterium]